MQTIEAIIDKDGNVELLENVRLPRSHRALLTILDDEPKENKIISNRELSDALNDAYTDDSDEEEKEFLRLAKITQMQVLDEWE